MSSNRPTSKVLRKSCQFCRARKIRCSGERVCGACRIRSIECVYGLESCRGRPRADRSKSASRKSALPMTRPDGLQSCKFGETDAASQTSASRDGSLGQEAESTFRRVFATTPTPSSDPSTSSSHPSHQTPRRTASRSSYPNVTHDSYTMGSSPASSTQSTSPSTRGDRMPVPYEDLFANLGCGLVELICNLFGSLGCSAPQRNLATYLFDNLAFDGTQGMFDAIPNTNQVPMKDVGDDHYVQQMIELWFLHHPLSFLVSKTIVLHRQRSGELDPAFLAVILADANYLLGGEKVEMANRLFASAAALLQDRPMNTRQLSTIQLLVLLGWHDLCVGRVRRGYVYMAMARRHVLLLHRELQLNPPSTEECIKSIPVSKVELELIQRMYWFTSSLELWCAIQMRMPLCPFVARASIIGFPALHASQSLALDLDQEAGNVAGIRRQEKLLVQLWPMCHVSATLANVYTIYLGKKEMHSSHPVIHENAVKHLTLSRLGHLGQSHDEVAMACVSARESLFKVIKCLEDSRSSHFKHITAIAAYRMISLHLLFPPTVAETTYMSESTFQTALTELTQFRDLTRYIEALPRISTDTMETLRHVEAEIFLMAIGTCAKVLERIIDANNYGPPGLREVIAPCRAQLVDLVSCFHATSKFPVIRFVFGSDEVKRRLKAVKSRLIQEGDGAGNAFLPGESLSLCNSSNGEGGVDGNFAPSVNHRSWQPMNYMHDDNAGTATTTAASRGMMAGVGAGRWVQNDFSASAEMSTAPTTAGGVGIADSSSSDGIVYLQDDFGRIQDWTVNDTDLAALMVQPFFPVDHFMTS